MERLVLRRVVLLGTPLALAILEIFHPDRPNSASEAVEQGVWFMWFHFIQVPLIGLIALAVYLLTEGLEGQAVSVSRWAIGVFAVFFSAYDAAAGIGTGYALRQRSGTLSWSARGHLRGSKGHAGCEPDLRPLDRGDRCLGGGAYRSGESPTGRRCVLWSLHLADTGGGVLDGRASLPGWHAGLRVLLPSRCVA
jgi:hypothetical protein